MKVYYNEIDKKACAWLRELMNDGLIPEGVIDDRSIIDVQPGDLRGYTQCHFFAGIGGWSLALRLAGWPEDRPVWTGSCPCQPLSCAGKGLGHADERHLWPAFYRLISECNPPTVFGEQVASKDGREWFAGIRADLEDLGYACGCADLCAAGVGAPHIRQRLYWVADAELPDRRAEHEIDPNTRGRDGFGRSGAGGGLGNAECGGRGENNIAEPSGISTNGIQNFWSSAIWHACRDGKARRVPSFEFGVFRLDARLSEGVDFGWLESSFPLARKIQGRVGLLKGYGNAIIPQVAAEFISAYLETT